MNKIKIAGVEYVENSPEHLEATATLIKKCLSSGILGMEALADIIAKAVKKKVDAKIVTPDILQTHVLPAGAEPKYQVKSIIKAIWMSIGGDPRRQQITKNEVVASTERIIANPEVDIYDLQNGNIGTINDLINDSADEIRKEVDKRTFSLIDAAVDPAMEDSITGGVLTRAGLALLVGLLSDKELRPALIAMRGAREADIINFTGFSDKVSDELLTKGYIGRFGGARILNTMAISDPKYVYAFPQSTENLGKFPIRERLSNTMVDHGLQKEIISYYNVGMIILNPLKMARLEILP